MSRSQSDRSNNALWLCKCDCGKEVTVRSAFLKRGQQYCSKQCPLYRDQKRIDLHGKMFGWLTAVSFVRSESISRKAIWLFECKCGRRVERQADNVVSGNSKSCGCYGIESRVKHGMSQTLAYHREAHKAWALRNPAKVIANANKRRSDFDLRIPSWLTSDDWQRMDAVYREAQSLSKTTGVDHHVDHIFPLRGKTVSGLHVPTNLRAIPWHENLQKSCRFPDDVC